MGETLAQLVADVTGVSPAEVRLSPRPALAYQSNRLIDAWAGGHDLIVKEFLKPDEFDDAPVREYRALRLLARLDIAPQPVCRRPRATPAGLSSSTISWKGRCGTAGGQGPASWPNWPKCGCG